MSEEFISAHFAADIRSAELQARAGLAEDSLMQRAAAGLAVVCLRLLREGGGVSGRRVVLLVGSGNNGADALLAGVRLRERGVAVIAVLTADHAYQAGITALRSAGGTVITLRQGVEAAKTAVAAADLVMDGVAGLSGTPGLPERVLELLAVVATTSPVVAVDIPSGMVADTGEVSGPSVRADVTVTFGAWKPCLLAPPAAYGAGHTVFVDVGLCSHLPATARWRRLTARGVGSRWPVPERVDHKYRRGVLGVVAGSDMYPGAAVLACAGAVRAGAGVVRYVGPPGATQQVLIARPEVVPGSGRVQAWLLGSGVEEDPEQDAAIEEALESGLPCVVDAGALDACVRRRASGARQVAADRILLTPHAGELARMLTLLGPAVEREEVEARPVYFARQLATAVDATVLLKGSITLIVDPGGAVVSQDDGPPWLATAGSGDVLAGAAGALLAAGVDALHSGAMAACVHGRAAHLASAGGPVAALDVADAIPEVIAQLLQDSRDGGLVRRVELSRL